MSVPCPAQNKPKVLEQGYLSWQRKTNYFFREMQKNCENAHSFSDMEKNLYF